MSPQISGDAFNLIVTEEVGSERRYIGHYTHFEWPGGRSGATVGCGYDCGYAKPAEIRVDWDGILDAANIDALVRASGLQGNAAHEFVLAHKTIVTVSWDQAMTEFRNREIPKWIARVGAHLPNLDKLSPDSLGALVSLAYNRGPSFDAEGDHYREMRAIKAHMALAQFDAIPADILAMQRLWPKDGDLWRRRAHEAALFKRGLTEPPASILAPAVIGSAPAAPAAAARGAAPPAPVPVPAHLDGLPALADTFARIGAFVEAHA